MTAYTRLLTYLKQNRDISEWKLFIDESHTATTGAWLQAYKAVRSVLSNFKEYG